MFGAFSSIVKSERDMERTSYMYDDNDVDEVNHFNNIGQQKDTSVGDLLSKSYLFLVITTFYHKSDIKSCNNAK